MVLTNPQFWVCNFQIGSQNNLKRPIAFVVISKSGSPTLCLDNFKTLSCTYNLSGIVDILFEMMPYFYGNSVTIIISPKVWVRLLFIFMAMFLFCIIKIVLV